ncbi:MAG TPA: dTDP-4-dehydrorhamnose reductase [Candidatus Andersenbacteria bacterium]|nr:dTDP-4-dehydrorhamnose reductase [Candidatus Andersenbacteria bacterium]
MRVVIIGAKGMLGTMLASVFADVNPTLLDKEEIDITSPQSVRDVLMPIQPEVIINAAAYTNVDAAEDHKEDAFLVNETGVKNLGEIANMLEAIVVHFSTDYVFPGTQSEGYSESDSPGPAVNIYGQSKLAGERALKESGCNFYLVRTAWLYGPNGKNFVDTMIEIAKKNKNLSVVNDQFGSPTFTKDVAQFVRTLLEEQLPFGIYHGVNSGSASWFEFAEMIFTLIPGMKVDVKPVSSSEFPRPAKRPPYSILRNTKGPEFRDWKDALREYLTR